MLIVSWLGVLRREDLARKCGEADESREVSPAGYGGSAQTAQPACTGGQHNALLRQETRGYPILD